MSRLASDKILHHDLGNGEYIECRTQLTYAELEPILGSVDTKKESANLKMAIPLLELAVTGWRLVDDDGQDIPFDKEKIKQLDSATVVPLFTELVGRYFPQKKN